MKNAIINYEHLQERIIEIRGQKVLLDSDVAEIYGVETKHINQAVKNNPDKFPFGYVIELDQTELGALRSKILTAKLIKSRSLPKAFPEKGLYMLRQPSSKAHRLSRRHWRSSKRSPTSGSCRATSRN